MKAKELANKLGVSHDWVWRRIKQGLIPLEDNFTVPDAFCDNLFKKMKKMRETQIKCTVCKKMFYFSPRNPKKTTCEKCTGLRKNQDKKYYKKHKEEILKNKKKRYKENKEKRLLYLEKNKEKIRKMALSYSKKYREKNREILAEKNREYQKKRKLKSLLT